MISILSHTVFLLGAYSVCVHHASVFCVCTLCFSTSSFFLFLLHTFFLCIHACTPMCYIIPRHPFGGLHIWRALYIWRNIFCLEGYLLGGLYAWRAVSLFFWCFSLCLVSVAGSTFFSLPDGLRHLYRDHNPYSILHIPYSMLYVIYDLEGSNDVNLQSTEFDPCR